MVSPFLFFADERLSLAELTAACLDGALVPLGEGYMPADAAETKWMRARSVAPLLGDRWAAIRLTAAWVHGGIAREPAIHHLQRVRAARVRAGCDLRAVFHDVRLPADDIMSVAGVPVSTPARTLVDLARSDAREEIAAARAWAYRDPLLRRDAEVWFERHPRFPHVHRATRLLRAAADAGAVPAEGAGADADD